MILTKQNSFFKKGIYGLLAAALVFSASHLSVTNSYASEVVSPAQTH